MDKTDAPTGNVTPEEQKMYDAVMLAARTNIYGDAKDDTRFKMVVQRLMQGRQDLASNVGGIAAVTMLNIAGSAQKQGKQVPGDVLLHAGDELVDDLLEIAEKAGLSKPAQHDELKKQAMFDGIKLFAQDQQKQKQGAAGGQPPPGAGAPAPQGAPPPAQPQAQPSGIINAARAGA